MRLAVPLLTLLLVLAACGSEQTESGSPTATSGADEPTASAPVEPTGSLPVETRPDPSGPPWILLRAEAGEQRAVQGSYCVSGPEGMCVDYGAPVQPEQLTVVRPGEQVELVVLGTETAAGSVGVRELGCSTDIATFELDGPSTRWTVDLAPGSYELHVFATFETGTASGDTSAAVGLHVDESAKLALIPRPEQTNPCVER